MVATSPPLFSKNYTFKVDVKKGQSIVSSGKVDTSRKGYILAGSGWRDLMLPEIESVNKLCLLDRRISQPRIRTGDGSGAYFQIWVKCKRNTVKGVLCDVRYKISREGPTTANEESVEFRVVQLSGDVLANHYEEDGTATFARKNVTGEARVEMKDLIRESNKSAKQLVQDFAKESAENGALLTGNLTQAVSLSAVKHMIREIREEDQITAPVGQHVHCLQ